MPRGLKTEHGTRSRYQGTKLSKGCRCDDCKDANAIYTRNLRQSKKAWTRPYNRRPVDSSV